jgi:hypothetical protein
VQGESPSFGDRLSLHLGSDVSTYQWETLSMPHLSIPGVLITESYCEDQMSHCLGKWTV